MTTEEIQFFDKLSASWDKHEVLSTPEKVKEILGFAMLEKGMDVADLGTGTGVLVPYISQSVGPDGSVTAVDISEGMLGKAKEKYGSLANVSFARMDFEAGPLPGRYDVVFLYCVYPHLHTPVETLKRLVADNLKPGGRVIIAFPCDESFINDIHKEKKAESKRLPSAPVLASTLCARGLNAAVKACDAGRYVVEITES